MALPKLTIQTPIEEVVALNREVELSLSRQQALLLRNIALQQKLGTNLPTGLPGRRGPAINETGRPVGSRASGSEQLPLDFRPGVFDLAQEARLRKLSQGIGGIGKGVGNLAPTRVPGMNNTYILSGDAGKALEMAAMAKRMNPNLTPQEALMTASPAMRKAFAEADSMARLNIAQRAAAYRYAAFPGLRGNFSNRLSPATQMALGFPPNQRSSVSPENLKGLRKMLFDKETLGERLAATSREFDVRGRMFSRAVREEVKAMWRSKKDLGNMFKAIDDFATFGPGLGDMSSAAKAGKLFKAGSMAGAFKKLAKMGGKALGFASSIPGMSSLLYAYGILEMGAAAINAGRKLGLESSAVIKSNRELFANAFSPKAYSDPLMRKHINTFNRRLAERVFTNFDPGMQPGARGWMDVVTSSDTADVQRLKLNQRRNKRFLSNMDVLMKDRFHAAAALNAEQHGHQFNSQNMVNNIATYMDDPKQTGVTAHAVENARVTVEQFHKRNEQNEAVLAKNPRMANERRLGDMIQKAREKVMELKLMDWSTD